MFQQSIQHRWVPVQHSIRSLCREWLSDAPRLLHGFLSRRQTEELLADKREGTFLFRFSTSHLGLLSISFVGKPSRHGPGGQAQQQAAPEADGGSGGNGSKKPAAATQIRHFLVQVEEGGRCVVFMEPGRSRHNSLRDLVLSSASLLEFYPGVPKAQALAQLKRFE